jgi:tetratricopeptide (TPR) repeat protein
MRVIEIDPLDPIPRVHAADVLAALDRNQEALEILQPVADSDRAEVLGALAVVRLNFGDRDEARALAELALERDGDEHRAQAVLASLENDSP